MTQDFKVIAEFDHSSIGIYHVERQYHGWEWRYDSSWETEAAAFYSAEKLSHTTGDKTRVGVNEAFGGFRD